MNTVTHIGSIGVIFALESEAGGLIDRLKNVTRIAGSGVVFHVGELPLELENTEQATAEATCRVIVTVSGVGRVAAAAATRLLLDTYKPASVISAGFAGGLRKLQFTAATISRVILCEDRSVIELDTPSVIPHIAVLLTCDEIISTPVEKRKLGTEFDADLVDMETFAIASVCRERDVPLIAVRKIFDACDEEISPATGRVMRASQQGTARLLGSLARTLVTKPSALVELYSLKERALVASDELAEYVCHIVKQYVNNLLYSRGSGT